MPTAPNIRSKEFYSIDFSTMAAVYVHLQIPQNSPKSLTAIAIDESGQSRCGRQAQPALAIADLCSKHQFWKA